MEYYKIYNLSKDTTVSKFAVKKWIKVDDLSDGQCSANKNIKFKIPMLRFS